MQVLVSDARFSRIAVSADRAHGVPQGAHVLTVSEKMDRIVAVPERAAYFTGNISVERSKLIVNTISIAQDGTQVSALD